MTLGFCVLVALWLGVAVPARACGICHAGVAPGTAHTAPGCPACHGGNAAAVEREDAHREMRARPGLLDGAARACGGCHPQQVAWVTGSEAHSMHPVIRATRRALGEPPGPADPGDAPVDQLLRKLCLSCHLGAPRSGQGADPILRRGGGCLACHLQERPGAHPWLTRRVPDTRCAGCHSRSSRISLGYPGLAEVESEGDGRLADGRRVERHPADVHHRAGMGCTDCHSGPSLMGAPAGPGRDPPACERCHGAAAPPGDAGAGRPVAPAYDPARHPLAPEHARLTCSACHARWAPQCHGCHLRYEAQGEQWDHWLGRATPGRWVEERSLVRNTAPPLGVTASGRIAPFVPGMILTVAHPAWPQPRLHRLFSNLEPHTSGPARSCESCHRSAPALGLGEGTLERGAAGWTFTPAHPRLADGLPADAWTTLDASTPGQGTRPGERSLDREEIRRVLEAALPGR